MNIKGSKHLTLNDRIKIEALLVQGKSLKDISYVICKDERTIAKEIFKRRNKIENKRYFLYDFKADEYCKKYKRFPFTCMTCKDKKYCRFRYKYEYDAKLAQENYEITLRDSRIGLDCTLEDMALFDKTLCEGTKKGQSINHIVKTNPDKIKYSVSSAYRLINEHKTNVSFFDLKLKVKLKPRKKYKYTLDKSEVRKNRTYADFINFLSKHPNIPITEIDTVESVADGEHKCLLTIHFTLIHAMIIFILKKKTAENVNNVFIYLQNLLGPIAYKKLFPVVLTDRGTEFCNPLIIETNQNNGRKLSNVFFCNSYASYQKGAIEENHTFIRRVIPKGIIFDHLTQDEIDILVSNINSYYRESIEATPYTLMKNYFGIEILNKLKVREIPPDQVTLTPNLLK